jgi:hypothetical protein
MEPETGIIIETFKNETFVILAIEKNNALLFNLDTKDVILATNLVVKDATAHNWSIAAAFDTVRNLGNAMDKYLKYALNNANAVKTFIAKELPVRLQHIKDEYHLTLTEEQENLIIESTVKFLMDFMMKNISAASDYELMDIQLKKSIETHVDYHFSDDVPGYKYEDL